MNPPLFHPGLWRVWLLALLVQPAGGQTTPVAAGGPPAKAEPGDNADALASAEEALGQAVDAMQTAEADNKGGYVERARDDLAQASDNLTEWLAYLQGHPEVKLLPLSPAEAIDVLGARIGDFNPSGNPRSPNLRSTLISLHTVLGALQHAPGGDTGGFRSRLVASIDRAATDVIAGMNYAIANAGSGTSGTAPRTITPLGPPANATAFYSGSMSVTKRLELARRALEQTETALRLPPTSNLDELAVAPFGRDLALAACDLAGTELTAALAYIQKYPANDDLTGGLMSPEDPPLRLAELPPALDRNPAGRFTNPPVVAALDALNEALNALTNARPNTTDGIPHPIIGDLDGHRLKLLRDIVQVQTAINGGFNITYDAYVKSQTKGRRTGPGGVGN